MKRMTQKDWHFMILGVDRGVCVNSHWWAKHGQQRAVSAHHIKYRSEGGESLATNGMSFCGACDHKAHNGGYHPDGDGGNGGRVSGRVFVYLCLERLRDKPIFRWEEALRHLERTSEVQRWLNK